MFGIFSRPKRVAGIDIKADCIRFVEIEITGGSDRITSYGEVTFEDSDPGEDELVQYLKDIKKNLKARIINVSIPVGSDEKVCVEILKSSGIKAEKITSPAEPLEFSCVPERSETSFIVVDAENSQINFLTLAPGVSPRLYTSDPANHSIISNLNRLYIDWYDRHKERIHHVLFSGSRAADQDFLDYISRETKIVITKANVFVNLKLDKNKVPIIPKNDSYKYAIAIGLAIT